MHCPQELVDLFEYIELREEREKGFKLSILSMYERNSRWAYFLGGLTHVLALFFLPKNGGVKYFFWGNRFEQIILNLPRSEVCVVGGPKQLLFCLRHQLSFIPYTGAWKVLLGCIKGKSCSVGLLQNLINKLSSKLNAAADDVAWLVLDNDSLPMQRSVVRAARACTHLQVACIQDGIFQSKSPSYIFHGYYSDLLLVINDHQKNMLVDHGLSKKKLRVMGFHSAPYIPRRKLSSKDNRLVCFLGQPWLKYDRVLGRRYLEIVGRTMACLRSQGIPVVYKPHPWEKGEKYLENYEGVVDVSLINALESYDVFISLTSTALLEAQESGRVAVQLLDDFFDQDEFSVHGCISSLRGWQNEEFGEELIRLVRQEGALNRNLQNPAQRFLSSLKEEG